jgi:hypothetical protein
MSDFLQFCFNQVCAQQLRQFRDIRRTANHPSSWACSSSIESCTSLRKAIGQNSFSTILWKCSETPLSVHATKQHSSPNLLKISGDGFDGFEKDVKF